MGLNPCRGKRIFSSLKRPNRLWGPPSLLLDECRVKHEFGHSRPCIAAWRERGKTLTFDGDGDDDDDNYCLLVFVKSIAI